MTYASHSFDILRSAIDIGCVTGDVASSLWDMEPVLSPLSLRRAKGSSLGSRSFAKGSSAVGEVPGEICCALDDIVECIVSLIPVNVTVV